MSITVTLSSKNKPQALLIPVSATEANKGIRTSATAHLSAHLKDAKELFDAANFAGKAGQCCVHVAGSVVVAFVGLGDLDKAAVQNMETLRRALGTGYNALRASKKETILLCLPGEQPFGLHRDKLLEQVATLLHVASYSFVEFKKDKKVWEPTIVVADAAQSDAAALEAGAVIGEAMNVTRGLADTPPNHLYPEILAKRAEAIAKKYNLKYTVFGQEKAREMGMGCYYSVAKGSVNEGKFVTLEYAPKKKDVPTIALVGKGVCFDTGGISLKPANAMSGMKYDMSGAAAVYGAMQAIAQLKPDVRVIGVTPLVENMPSAQASKQDDVVTAMNGKTVEIENTDAEGRLILADALCYVQKEYDPAAIIDIATLTGACAYFLGHFYAGLMTRDEALCDDLLAIGQHVGDKLWRLPLTDEYKPALESPVADVANCGSPAYKAGATTAGLFLEHFIDKDRRWAHLDIAGTDSKIPGATYLGKGATGTGVRIMVDFARSYNK